MSYDGLGRLSKTVGTATTQFLYDGAQIVAEYDGSGTLLRRFVPDSGLDQPVIWYEGTGVATPRWLIGDRQGSIMAVTNSLGGSSASTFAINTYDEAGIGGSGNAGRFQFDGQPFVPEAGLYHMRARAYSPTLGRFMQPNPSGYADSLNLYHYALNDLVNAWDPTGLPCQPIGTGRFLCTGGDQPPAGGVTEITVTAPAPPAYRPPLQPPRSGAPRGGPAGSGVGPGGDAPPQNTQNNQMAPQQRQAFCQAYAHGRNDVSVVADSTGLAVSLIPGGGVVEAGAGLGLATVSLVNSARNGDVKGVGLGAVGYHVTAIGPAAAQFGKAFAEAIPVVGTITAGISVAYDLYSLQDDYKNCINGKTGG